MKKIRCPDCRELFEIDETEYDEGDYINCPECNAELVIVEHVKGKFKIKLAKEVEMEDADEHEEEEVPEEFE